MFNILGIEIDNFRSYVGSHKFDFPRAAGLYSVTGQNLVNPRLGANGIGKSTLLDAIYWCLYGRTTRGLRGGEVLSYGKKSCVVSVFLLVGKVRIQIDRGQSPNGLDITEDGKTRPVDQEAVNKALRMSPEAFLHAVMLPQFGESFFDLTPTAKLALFSQIMGLDYWLEKSKLASLLASDIDASIADITNQVSRLKGQLEANEADIKHLTDKKGSFSKSQAQIISALEQDLKQQRALGAKLATSIGDLKNVLKGAERRLAVFEQPIENSSVLKTKLSAAKRSFANLNGVGAVCPTCLQKMDSSHLKSAKAPLEVSISALEVRLAKVIAQEQDFVSLTRNKDDFDREFAKTKGALEAHTSKETDLRSRIEREKTQVNPFTKILDEKRQLIKAVTSKMVDLEREKGVLQKEHASISYWVAGFKRVRLFLIEETLHQLEVEVNNNLASLGLQDWLVTFDVERENKSGGLTKGFVVFVHSPDHKEPVRLEAWSGGETQRLRLAGDLGLANLIMERAGLRNTIEFFDEPSRHLSQEGLIDLAETLAQRAESDGKRIFLVDHNAIDFGGFQDTITIVKDKDGSRIK